MYVTSGLFVSVSVECNIIVCSYIHVRITMIVTIVSPVYANTTTRSMHLKSPGGEEERMYIPVFITYCTCTLDVNVYMHVMHAYTYKIMYARADVHVHYSAIS